MEIGSLWRSFLLFNNGTAFPISFPSLFSSSFLSLFPFPLSFLQLCLYRSYVYAAALFLVHIRRIRYFNCIAWEGSRGLRHYRIMNDRTIIQVEHRIVRVLCGVDTPPKTFYWHFCPRILSATFASTRSAVRGFITSAIHSGSYSVTQFLSHTKGLRVQSSMPEWPSSPQS